MASTASSSKNIVLTGMVNVLAAVKQIALLFLITKGLGVADYGIWTQVAVTSSLITPLTLLGMPYALNRFLPAKTDRREVKEDVYSALTLITLGLAVVFIALNIFAGPISFFLKIPVRLISILALIIVFESLNYAILRIFVTFSEIKKYSFFMICYLAAEILFVALAVYKGLGVEGSLIAYLAVRIAIFLCIGLALIKKIGFSLPGFTRIKEYLTFGLPLLSSDFFYWILVSSDRYVLGFFLGILAVGYYAPGYAMGNVLNFFTYPFAMILPPLTAKLFDEQKQEELKTNLKKFLTYMLAIMVPGVLGLTVLSKNLLAAFSTRDIADTSYMIVPVISLSILCYGIYIIYSQILVLHKKTKTISGIWAMAAVINLGLNLLLIRRFGLIAAAIDTLVAYAFALLATIYYSQKLLRFTVDFKSVVKIAGSALIMAVLVFLLHPANLLYILTSVAAGAAIYFFLLWVTKFFSPHIKKA